MTTKRTGAKTNAMRALDQRRIPYEAHEYDPEIKSAEEVAATLRVPPNEVYKTLVMLRDSGRPLVVMVPGDREVDPRTLARSIGARNVRMAPKQEAERLTGLQTGGIGALALLGKPFEVYIDRAALTQEHIFVNGGRRGLNLRLRTSDLIAMTGAQVADIG